MFSVNVPANSTVTIHAGRVVLSWMLLGVGSQGNVSNIAYILQGYTTATRIKVTDLTGSDNTGITFDLTNDTTVDIIVTNTTSLNVNLKIIQLQGPNDITIE